MPDDTRDASVHHHSASATAADHAVVKETEYLVAPTSAARETTNTLRPSLIPWACWKVEDICFDFDRAFVRPDAKVGFAELAKLCQKHPDSPLTIFGHADPVGQDQYNKELSERRAKAVYAVLTRDVGLWEQIYQKERLSLVQNTLAALGHDPGPIDGAMGSRTRDAIRSFEQGEGQPEKGRDTPDLRAKLFKKYMDWLCGEFVLTASDFLGDGQCAYQGCGEFCPIRMFSKSQIEYFKKPERKEERNQENQVNRRVVAYLFKPGTRLEPSKWPCRGGIPGCRKRFWSDASTRRQFQEQGREHRADAEGEGTISTKKWEYAASEETFACRFYDRLAHHSPCEQPVVPRIGPFIQFELFVYDVPVVGLECEIRRETDPQQQGQQGPGQAPSGAPPGQHGAQRMLLQETGTGACRKLTWVGPEERVRAVHGREVLSYFSHKHVMKPRPGGTLSKDMHGDSVAYDENYYVTEVAHLFPYVVETQEAFDNARRMFNTTQDQQFHTSEMLIWWDRENRRIIKCLLDGEEIAVEQT